MAHLTDWQPPPGFIPLASAVAGIEVYAPAPDKPEPERRVFKCPNCGASAAYSAADAALSCAHCGYTEAPAAHLVGRQAEAAEFKVETLEQTARGWGQTRRELHCESCGAHISLGPQDLATTCHFCASHRVVTRDESPSAMLRPSHLIPFQVDPETGGRLLRQWLAQGWMCPPGLRRVARSARLSGVYLSFWTFGARLDANWQAEVGRKKRYTGLDGKRRTKIVWKWKSGRLNVRIKDLLVPGTDRISERLLAQVYPYDLSALTVYDPAYLAGWRAQAYDLALRPAWDRARCWMRERAREAVQRDINSKYVRNLGITIDFEDEVWRNVLLPVYLVAYRYRGKVYQVLINGQTGAVAGQKPVAWKRVMGAVALLLLPGLALLIASGLLPKDAGGCTLMLGLVALVAGVALTVRIVRQALAADDA